MSLRKPAKAISFVLLFCLLAWYSRRYMGEVQEEILVAAWSRAFRRLNGDCIYWMALRLAAWLFIYLRLLRLESGFSVYLFLRRRSFARVFLRTYTGCLGTALCYYCLGTLLLGGRAGNGFRAAAVAGASAGDFGRGMPGQLKPLPGGVSGFQPVRKGRGRIFGCSYGKAALGLWGW